MNGDQNSGLSTCIGVPQDGLWVTSSDDTFELPTPTYGCGQQQPDSIDAINEMLKDVPAEDG